MLYVRFAGAAEFSDGHSCQRRGKGEEHGRGNGLRGNRVARVAQSPSCGQFASGSPSLMGDMTAAHFIFIPAVLLVGVVIGWILGSRAAGDAFAAELRKREERAAREQKKIAD